MRHPEPEVVKIYRAGPPKCCHTCACYNSEGVCIDYRMVPPEDFAATIGACEKWLFEVPF